MAMFIDVIRFMFGAQTVLVAWLRAAVLLQGTFGRNVGDITVPLSCLVTCGWLLLRIRADRVDVGESL